MIRLNDLSVPLEADANEILTIALQKSGIPQGASRRWHLARKAVDARDKSHVHFACCVELEFETQADEAKALDRCRWKKSALHSPALPASFESARRPASHQCAPPVVVGAGPAGLFAALALAEAGMRPIVIERGRPVSERRRDVQRFFAEGILDTSSNVQFGEGGAGTFSDGKLNTGIHKDAFTARVIQSFVEAGAPEEILWSAHPHLGTDRLPGIVTRLREKIQALGGTFLFGTRLVSLKTRAGSLSCIEIEETEGGILKKRALETSACFLCIGHSARDTFAMLENSGVHLLPKPFSIGVRIEHPQRLIDEAQYGRRFARHPALGAADYKLAVHLPNGRGVYTFCMCPGGEVVAAASEEGMVVTNGMSAFARDGQHANAALLVGITPEDFGGTSPLSGVEFQRRFERLAFAAGGRNYAAPATRVEDFLKKRASRRLGTIRATYRPAVTPADVSDALPAFAASALREAIPLLDRRLHGFAHPDAVLTAVESRSSSPVRIVRGENFQSASLPGLYPCGEGAGYAGGITSSAADGLKAAAAFLGMTF